MKLALRGSLAVLLAVVTSTRQEATAQSTFTVRGTVNIQSSGASQQPDLGQVVVFVDAHPRLQPHDPIGKRPQIEQKNKAYNPKLLVVSRGTIVEFPNRDPYSHNVFSRSSAAQFDLDRYPQGVSKSYTFQKVGVVQLFCNIHPQMRAVVMVVPNRHFARADDHGRFELHGLPSGQYALVAWHARTGARRETIDVGPQSTRDITMSLAARPSRVRGGGVHRRRHGAAGVERSLGLKRERLNLPVVQESHSAPSPRP